MAWIVSGLLSSLLLGGMLGVIAALLAPRWGMIADILATGSPVSQQDGRLASSLRFAA